MFHVQGQFINTMLKLFILVPFQFSDQVLHIKEKVNENREWAVIKSGKTRLWLEHKNHGDIWRSSAYRENEMRWHTMFNQFSDLSPDNKQSSHTGKENISRQTFKRKRFTFAEPWTSGCLLLWIWFFHDISGHIRDFLFPSCQNNLVVYKWVAAFSL